MTRIFPRLQGCATLLRSRLLVSLPFLLLFSVRLSAQICPPCSELGNLTFVDFNGNGVFDAGDTPLPQVLVSLLDADTDAQLPSVPPTLSDVDGNYTFTDVPPGNYYLRFEPPIGYVATVPAPPGQVDNANAISPASGNGALSTADFVFNGTAPNNALDAGFVGQGSIGGRVWADNDFGMDANEPGVDGVGFVLEWIGPDAEWDSIDDVVLNRTSQGGGAFQYLRLPHGQYRLYLNSVAGTVLASDYDLIMPAAEPITFTIDDTNLVAPEVDYIFQPRCLPDAGRLTTTSPLVMCGNAALGIYTGQGIRVTLNDFTPPTSGANNYDFWVLVVDAAGDIVQAQPIPNPTNGLLTIIDLAGFPTGDYRIHTLHYLRTDPNLLVPFNLSVGQPVQPVLDRLLLLNGAPNTAPTANVCGSIGLAQNTLLATMNPQPPYFLGCLGAVNVTLNNQCAATVTPQMVLTGDWGCLRPFDFQVNIYQNGQLVSNSGALNGCGTYQYEVVALLPGTQGFPCWGTVFARDVAPPTLVCPADVNAAVNANGLTDLACADVDQLRLVSPTTYIVDGDGVVVQIDPALRRILDVTGYPAITDGCDYVRVFVSDALVVNGSCGTTQIVRTFRAEDKYNSACAGTPNASMACTQRITFRKLTQADVVLPPATVELDCNAFSGVTNPTPAQIATATGVAGHPAVFGFFDALPATLAFDPHLLAQSYCNLGASYSDRPRINGCGASYTFIRDWYIVDDCNPSQVLEFTQIIRIKDTTPPVLTLPTVDYNGDGVPDIRRYSTSPFSCLANIPAPAPTQLSDFCSGPPVVVVVVRNEAGNFVFSGAPGQVFSVPVGNYSLRYCATDACGNETCADMLIRVRDEIAPSAACNNALTVSIGGGSVVNGELGIARILATNVDEGSADNCSPVALAVRRNFWNNGDCGLASTQYSDWGDFVDFYCCDVGRAVTIEMRVTDASGNVNNCALTIVPEDKLRPTCAAPANRTLTCLAFAQQFSGDIADAYNTDFRNTSLMMSQLFGAPSGNDNCAVDTLVERTPTININNCGWGSITRRFEAWQLNPAGDTNGNGAIDAGEVLRSTNTCSQTITITATHEYVIDFPADADADCSNPDYAEVIVSSLGCDNLAINRGTPQRFSATGDECYKLSITYDIINWCTWDGQADAYMVPRQTDTDNISVDRCERPIVRVTDAGAVIDRNHPEPGCGSNLPNVFNVAPAQYVGRWSYTQFIKVYDNSEPTFTVSDFGGPTALCPTLPARTFGALDNENCDATVAFTFSLDDACEVFNQNGTLVLSIVSANIDWFATDTNADGSFNASEFQSEANAQGLISYQGGTQFAFQTTAPLIPAADGANVYHVLRVEALDGCGNRAAHFIPFRVVDCKAPAPICINGLTATLTFGGQGFCEATIWATDFLGSPIADCSGPIQYAIYRTAEVLAAGPGFVPNPLQTGLTLTMEDEAETSLRIYAIDAAGNFDYCETSILVQPSRACVAQGAIGGMIRTEQENPVANVLLSLSGPLPMSTMSATDGSYRFDELDEDFDYTVTAYRNDNHVNGVTTLDIIIISKHILALQFLSSPYKLIAADVNQSGTVTTLDLIQMRKLILNITTEYPNNTSWRFIRRDFNFPTPTNPWASFFPELININDLIGENLNAGFVGVKIGDVNGSAMSGM